MSSPAAPRRHSSKGADSGIEPSGPSPPHSSPHLHLPYAPSRQVELDANDVQEQVNVDKLDHKSGASTPAEESESGSVTARRIIAFAKNDPDDPTQWPWKKKSIPLGATIACVMNSTVSSSLAAGAVDQISAHFHITNQAQLVLPTSIFLVGYVVGPLVFGPLSEWYGRRHVMSVAFAVFTIFSMACALADSFAALVVFRLLVGITGSCAISVTGGIIADLYSDPTARGRAMAIFMATTTFGPLIGPVASGYISTAAGWRWAFWLGLIIAGVAWIPLLASPETYAPVILARRAKRLRKQTGETNVFAPMELEPRDWRHVATVVLTRPIRMLMFEWIVLFASLYLAFVYAVFYMFFQAYPIMYGDTYNFSAGEVGLTFLPIGLGALIASAMYLGYDSFLARARARNAAWTRSEEARRLPLACAAGPFIVLSLFWAGWTAGRTHWAVPVCAGVPFGVGYLLCFMAVLNYLVDAYETFAASAMAASGTSRSIFGAALPFAARPMYETLGVAWACSLLGFVMLGLCVIPFAFWRFGDAIRANSSFCNELKKKEEKEEERDGGEEKGRVTGEV